MAYALFEAEGEKLLAGIALYLLLICVVLGILGRCLGNSNTDKRCLCAKLPF
jgi:hypothetical protein